MALIGCCSANQSLTVIGTLAPWVTIVITIAIWYKNQEKGREQEKFKKLLDYRLNMLTEAKEFFDFMVDLSKNDNLANPEFAPRLFKLRRSMEQFGNDDEYKLFEEFGHFLFTLKDVNKANKKLDELRLLITNNIRKELGLPARSFVKFANET